MDDREWMHRLNRRPIRWWLDLRSINLNQEVISTDPRIVEYNYTRCFHPVHLEQWIQVFQHDEETDIFDQDVYYVNVSPFNLERFIWHQNILHRIETHHQCEWFFNPIGEELPYHFIFQAISSLVEGEFYFIHLYGQRLHYLWDAVFALLRLDYNPDHFVSIGLEPNDKSTLIPWLMDRERMGIWLATRHGIDHRIHLSYFQFGGHSTDEIIRAVGNGTLFNFTYCVFEDGNLYFNRNYLSMLLQSNQIPSSLLYRILRTNVDKFG